MPDWVPWALVVLYGPSLLLFVATIAICLLIVPIALMVTGGRRVGWIALALLIGLMTVTVAHGLIYGAPP